MCTISNPIVRLGRVLSFGSASNGSGINFDSETSRDFSAAISELNPTVVSERLGGAATLVLDSQETEIIASEDAPTEFSNDLIVVKFGDTLVRSDGLEFRIGASATVCRGSKKSKVWCRVSSVTETLKEPDAARILELQYKIADAVNDELASIYNETLNSYLASCEKTADYQQQIEYVFLLEAGDYASEKLYDSITTLRETGNLFQLHDEGDWEPLKDLFLLSAARQTPELYFEVPAEDAGVDDDYILGVTNTFNESDRALTWEVTLGRHGLFAAEEISKDPHTGAPRTRMIGLCSQHSVVQQENEIHPPSWLVSGQIAPKLGADF